MSAVLYRKYRPRKFEEIVGQEHIVKTLKNAIKQGRIAHAYLFSGPRGTGKTTIARILAKTINCANPKDSEPCNECLICNEINQNKFLDLVEIDAATHTQVDKIRDIIEKIDFSPSSGKYKVYIIDEVHMLSKGAFNALLKTLEEPPRHIIFILATTEIHKIPSTIISRCQRFDFRRLRIPEIINRLERIAREEKIKVEKGVLDLIAVNSNGALRDSESLLGQIISLEEDNIITLEEAQTMLSVTDVSVALKMTELLLDKKYAEAISYINEITEDGYDLEQFAKSVIEYCRKIMLIKISPRMKESFSSEMTEEQILKLEEISKKTSVSQAVGIIRAFIKGKEEIKSSIMPQLPLEIAVAEINLTDNGAALTEKTNSAYDSRIRKPIEKITSPVRQIGRKVSESIKQSQDFIKKSVSACSADRNFEKKGKISREKIGEAAIKNSGKTGAAEREKKAGKENNTAVNVEVAEKPNSLTLDAVRGEWCDILEEIKPHNHSLTAFLKTCQPVGVEEKEIIISCKYSFHKDKLQKVENRRIIEETAEKILKTKVTVRFITEDEAEKRGYKVKEIKPPSSDNDNKENNLVDSVLEIFGGEVV